MLPWILCIIGAYLLGSIPFGLMIGLSRGVDIRRAGSGNVGATNVGRLLGRRVGVACFVLDALKGAIPVTVAGLVNGVWGRAASAVTPGELWLWVAVAVAALLGHVVSPWLGFRGGKGVATGFGAMLAMWPHLTAPALAALVVWLVVVRLTRYVSLASIAAALSLPVASLFQGSVPIVVTTAALAVLVVFKHRTNIGRLRAGTESRVGGDGPAGPAASES